MEKLSSHFFLFLEYYQGIYIRSTDVFESCKKCQKAVIMANGEVEIEDPDGHKFYVSPHSPGSAVVDPIYKVKLNTPDLKRTLSSLPFLSIH